MTAQSLGPSENWDDDFEFSQSSSNVSSKPKDATRLEPSLEPRLSQMSEDWDTEDGLRRSPPRGPAAASSRTRGMGGISSRLDNWAEPGPSTPTKHAQENWDDDFEDKADSPPSRRHHVHRASHHTFHNPPVHALRTRHSYHTPPRPKPISEPENWDDDFDDPMDPSSSASPSKTDNENTPVMKRTRREAYANSSDEEDEVDFGFLEDKEDDKTLTARSRTAPMRPGSSSNSLSHASSFQSPPVPALPAAIYPSPIEPFPRSPTVSVFSIPTTSGRNSIGHFNSTSHLVLSGASSLAIVPPSPPQRERRRLRKKSRPPHMDNNVFELIEEQRDSSSPPLPPSTPERASSPPMVSMRPSSPLEAIPGSGGSRTPLLSRIGSVKRWGVRRKRASTGPAEVMMHEFGTSSGAIVADDGTSRPPSSLGQTQVQTPSSQNRNSNNAGGTRSAWFFRPGGAHYGAGSPPPGHAELKHESSLDQARLRPGAGVGGNEGGGQVPTTPSKGSRLSRRKASGVPLEYTSSGETGDGSSSTSGVTAPGKPSLGPNRRPSSMQVPNGAALAIGVGSNKFASMGTRHASYGSSIGRASSSRVFSTPTPTESAEHLPPIPALPPEGSRSFMGSVRKISLVGGKKHKNKKSSLEIAHIPPTSSQGDMGGDDGREQDADEDIRMESQLPAYSPELLPPIELHPPSPPRPINGKSPTHSIPLNISDGMEPMVPSTSAPASITISGPLPISASPVASTKAAPRTPGSPQSASLGRTAQVPIQPPSNATVPRRNSLGDLKIPARISQAQIGLKRDLGLVREFASSVDGLKELQLIYHRLLAEVQTWLESAPPSRATSPTVFSLVRTSSRLRSNTSPPPSTSSSALNTFAEHKQVAATLHAMAVKYKISWECAELLIELGGGVPPPSSPPASGPSSALSAPTVLMQAELDRRKNRERAITLSGEESKSPSVGLASGATTVTPSSTSGPPSVSWRASTGRHDLSQRQLVLLRDMLNSGELPSDDDPMFEENVNRNWRWGDAMNSTVTLPSEDSEPRGVEHGENMKKKRRRGRMGLTGLRDVLRMLKRSHSEQPPPVPALPSTASLNTDSSHCSHHYLHGQLSAGGAQRAAKTSTGPESLRSTKDMSVSSPYSGPPLNRKTSPRRPSLASIFRIGHKNKATASSSAGESSQDSRSDIRSASRGSTTTGDEEDWDRIEAAIDLDTAARALGIEGTATIKGRKGGMSPFLSEHVPGCGPALALRPVTPRRGQEVTQALRFEAEASPRSIRPMRSTRLSNVEEVDDGERVPQPSESRPNNRISLPRTSPHRPPSRGTQLPTTSRTGSVRSAQQAVDDPQGALPEIKLSMTPENIKPLLENAKEVHIRCHECIRELRALLDVLPSPQPASAR